jgi:uncharacterized protein (DUF849 family)
MTKFHVQACLNGSRELGAHPALPITPDDLAQAAAQVAAAGAGSVHVHPRDAAGRQSLEPEVIGAAVTAIRSLCPELPVGTSTASWIEPNVARRVKQVEGWTVRPDFASVNFSETGAVELARKLLEMGIQVEAGLASADDARLLVKSGLGPNCLRHLIEVEEPALNSALATADAIDSVLDAAGFHVERLMHGFDASCWDVLDLAVARGHSTRIGLEDTLRLPDGTLAAENTELLTVAIARARSSASR